mmetsp:Transcript_666/g.801  ORF Transcript_666/g.801 Transcript_666/m.801 type:complete len:469 (-) Transcript_666:949-2355(-)
MFQHKVPIEERTVGTLHLNEDKAQDGYTLFSKGFDTFLINNDGKVVHEWSSKSRKVFVAHLLKNGNLLRDGNESLNAPLLQTGGAAGYIEEVTWDNELVWRFNFRPFEVFLSHHNFEPLPNGNVLVLCWERKSKEEAIAVGRRPEYIPDNEVWNDIVVELEPDKVNKTAKIVWRWSAWDHLVQNFDPRKPEFVEDIAHHPDKLDINQCVVGGKNANRNRLLLTLKDVKEGEFKVTKAGRTGEKDWLHINNVSYDPGLDQVMLSVNSFSEVIIISRKSGRIVYRRGNPAAQQRGTQDDRSLFCQHSAKFYTDNQGNRSFIVYNNGRLPDRAWTSVDIIRLPKFNETLGLYDDAWQANAEPPTWSYGYTPGRPMSWFDTHIGHCQVLENGNILILQGTTGTLVEVTKEKTEAWRYYFPVYTNHESGVAFVRQKYHRPFRADFRFFMAAKYPPSFSGLKGKKLCGYRYLEA